MSRPRSFTSMDSPVFAWRKNLDKSIKKLSVEFSLQMYRSTAPLSGFNICLAANGKQYSILIAPMRIYAKENGEVIVLRKNLDNGTNYNNYNISLREDGMAQIYFNDELVGLIQGEETIEKGNSILIGKTIPQGNMTVNLNEISIIVQ